MKLNPADAALAMQANDSQDLVRRKLEMDALRQRLTGDKDQKARLREACEGFESIFIQKMWEQMRKNVPKEGYLHSKDEHMYQAMYDQEFSRKMAAAGGIGLADMLYEQLAQRQGDSSRTVSPSVNPKLPIVPAGSSPSGMRFNAEAQPLKPIRRENEGIALERKLFELPEKQLMPARGGKSFGPEEQPGADGAAGAQAGEALQPGTGNAVEPHPAAPAALTEPFNFEHYSQAQLEAELEGRENQPLPDQEESARVVLLSEQENAVLQAALDQAQTQANEFSSTPTFPAQAAAAASPLPPQAAAVSGSSGVADEEDHDRATAPGRLAPHRVSSPLADLPSKALRAKRPLTAPEHVPPLPGEVFAPFGWRTEEGRRVWHQGTDIAAAPGDPVLAPLDGRVAFAGEREGYGRLVILEHQGGWRTFYGNAALSGLKEGDRVYAGTEFAKVTAQPENSSAHLHFEMRRGELAVNPAGSRLQVAESGK